MERDERRPSCRKSISVEAFRQHSLSRIGETDARLKQTYGEPRRRDRDAISQLVVTILSQATTDTQTAHSFQELRRRFPAWEQVRDAPASEIAKAIHSSGLSRQKAPRIKAALQHITRERGWLDLGFLKRMPVEEARRWLMQIAGVGPKTASIVLLFTFNKPIFPVDTHIFRVVKRLGWIVPNATAEKAHDVLRAIIPPKLYYRLHINLIQHGRKICQARKPCCEMCPLTDLCLYFRQPQIGMKAGNR
jgi:endonuclease-3